MWNWNKIGFDPNVNCGVPYLGGWSLDTDPYFGQYWHFCGTIINLRTDRNPQKRGTQHHPRQRFSDMDMLYVKSSYNWRDIGTTKSIKMCFFCHSPQGVKKASISMNSLKITVLHDNTFYRYILGVTCFQFVWPYYTPFAYFLSSIYLWNHCKYMNVYLISFLKYLCLFFLWTKKLMCI